MKISSGSWVRPGGNWFRSYGDENWEFDEKRPDASALACINNAPMHQADRRSHGAFAGAPTSIPVSAI